MMPLPFTKMHGLGNDFVVLDGRRERPALASAAIKAIADRHTGIGCDQLIVIEPPTQSGAAAAIRFYNSDGSESAACGNGTRCVAATLLAESGTDRVTIETRSGVLAAWRGIDRSITVDMGMPRFDWSDIPLVRAEETTALDLGVPRLGPATCTSMGNPHATFFVADLDGVDLAELGPRLEHHPAFPQRANIGIAQIMAPDLVRLRVWERGAGLTLACGSAACAAVVAGVRRSLCARRSAVDMALGRLVVNWAEDGHVLLSGPVATSFTGTIDESLIAA